MSTPSERTVDQLVADLDRRAEADGEVWSLYRAHDGSWRAEGHKPHSGPTHADDPGARCCAGGTIRGALLALWETPRLPVIPRQPAATAGALRVEKDGNRWAVAENGQRIAWRRTKKEATEAQEQYAHLVRNHWEEWVTAYGAVAGNGTEGVDFYYARR